MSNWSEAGIGLVYFAGLGSAIILTFTVIMLIKPVKRPLRMVTGKNTVLWARTFLTSLFLISLLGALSVSFRDCNGNYDSLLESRTETYAKGLNQAASASQYLGWTLLAWLIILLILYIVVGKRENFKTGSPPA